MSSAPQTLTPADQDLAAIKGGEWPMREFPLGPREKPTRRQVIFKQSVLNEIYNHGRSAPEIEVCGVVVGNVYKDAMGPFVFIEACIRGNFSTGKAAQVTFTGQTWTHIQEVMDSSYPDMRILGWYHTHPGHGIFLSDMDLFIHKHFFNLPWHLAFVFDPQNQEEGLFAWRSGNMAIESFVVQKDVQPVGAKVARRVPEPYMPSVQYATDNATAPPAQSQPSAAQIPSHHDTPAVTAAAGAPVVMAPSYDNVAPSARPAAVAEVSELSARLHTLEKRHRWMTAALALAVLVAVAWPLVLMAMSILNASDTPNNNHLSPDINSPSSVTDKSDKGGRAASVDQP